MDFEITPEEQELVDSVGSVLARECPTALVRDIVENGSSPEQPWKCAFASFARGEISPEHSVLKLFSSEIAQRSAHLAAEVQGAEALDVEHESAIYDESFGRLPWTTQYFLTFRGTIAAGTSEIQRNIIAQWVLGLPRR